MSSLQGSHLTAAPPKHEATLFENVVPVNYGWKEIFDGLSDQVHSSSNTPTLLGSPKRIGSNHRSLLTQDMNREEENIKLYLIEAGGLLL